MVIRPAFRALALAAAVAWSVSPTAASAAGDRSLEVPSLVTEAELGRDGSMTVVETVTYRFEGGPFRQGLRTFEPGEVDRIRDLTVEEGGEALIVVPPPASGVDGWAWDLPEPASDSTHTYVVRYVVDDAVRAGTDVGELFWAFVGSEHPGIGDVRIRITLPQPVPPSTPGSADGDTSVLRAFAHGPSSGVVELADDRVHARVGDVPEGHVVEVRVVAPIEIFSDLDPGDTALLPAILADEQARIDDAERDERNTALGRWLTLASTLVAAAGTATIWRRFGREPAVVGIGEYWREPLTDPPAVVDALLHRGAVRPGRPMAATLVDLAQRGHLTIEDRTIERFGPDRRELVFTRVTPAPRDDSLAAHELHLLGHVFAAGTTAGTVTSTEIGEIGRDRAKATAFLDRWGDHVKAAYRERGYDQRERPPGSVRWMLVTAGVAGLGGVAALVLGSALGVVAIGAAVASVVTGAIVTRNRSAAGAEAAGRAEAERRFLRDVSRLEDAPIGHLVLWERFLVDAVTLGVARELLHGLAARFPAVVQDPAFGVWYHGDRGIDGLPDLPGTFDSTAMPGLAPSSTGSGGGFSSSTGGGGGGGGFGAR